MKMEEKGPFRLVYFVITIIVIFAFLIGLYFQDPHGFWNWFTTLGVCSGVVILVFVIAAIYGMVEEWKIKIYTSQEPKRLKQHQARFYCHICGKPSPQPYQYEDSDGYSTFSVVDYNKPTELVQCAQCQKWTCPDADPPHMEQGVCKNCMENIHDQK